MATRKSKATAVIKYENAGYWHNAVRKIEGITLVQVQDGRSAEFEDNGRCLNFYNHVVDREPQNYLVGIAPNGVVHWASAKNDESEFWSHLPKAEKIEIRY